MPDQSSEISLLEKTLSRKCKLHSQYSCEYLHIIPSDFFPRLCCQCIEERNIPASEYVSIRLLLESSTNTAFNAYPKLNDNSIAKKIQLYKNTSDKVQEDLSSFFSNLKSTISLAIEKKMTAQKDKLSSLQNCYQGIYDSLSQISQVEKLQEIIKRENEDQLKTFVNDQFSKADTYTQVINNKLLEYQTMYEGFSMSDPKSKLDQIVKLIERIECFPTNLQSQENNSQQQPSFSSQPQQQQEFLILQQQQQQMQQEEQQMQQEEQQKKLQVQQYQQQQQQQQQQEQQEQQKQQNQQQLQQQQQQENQIIQSTTSQKTYSKYASLVKQGFQKKILLMKKGLSVEKEREEEEWWSLLKEFNRSWRGEELKWSLYAITYEEWLSFSEEERKQQLSILQKEVGHSN